MDDDKETLASIAVITSGVLSILISALALIGKSAAPQSIPFSTWGGTQEMAIPTAVCLILMGSGLILIAGLIRSVARKHENV